MEEYKFIIKPAAEQDLDDTMTWYEEQKKGLGVSFYMKFLDAVSFIKHNPFLYQEIYSSFRRVVLKKFPYAIYYTLDESVKEVYVLAVWASSRNPDRLKKRLE